MNFSDFRTATAVDVHAFGDDPFRPLMLACLRWPGERGLAGHSDADAAAHALADALLIGSGVGELGTVFGTDRPQWANASGSALLSEALRLIRSAGWQPVNATLQIICQRPKFAPRKKEAEKIMTDIVGAPVSVAATSTDHLGFIGEKKGIAALASVLLFRGGDVR